MTRYDPEIFKGPEFIPAYEKPIIKEETSMGHACNKQCEILCKFHAYVLIINNLVMIFTYEI